MEALRFTIVAIGGVVLDLTIAYTLSVGFGLPLWLAATAGFVCAALVNYIMHELWTFGTSTRRVSAPRAAKYVLLSVVTLAVRVAVVSLLVTGFETPPALPILVAGAAASFAVNFALSKFLMFAPDAPSETAQKR